MMLSVSVNSHMLKLFYLPGDFSLLMTGHGIIMKYYPSYQNIMRQVSAQQVHS